MPPLKTARALEWKGRVGGKLRLLEQTLLPDRVEYLQVRDLGTLIAAIKRLAVRGAPAIGCAAAYGVVLGMRETRSTRRDAFLRQLDRVTAKLAASRPTAVNLFWALDRMSEHARSLEFESLGVKGVLSSLLDEALEVQLEDERLCRAIGDHGSRLLRSGQTVLTHCNAGALATGGMGTALSVIYRAVERGKRIAVVADETRPLLQGARLTSWELARAGIDVTVICDNAAASLMRSGRIDAVVTGADRIALNGDVANKIGTYGVAVLAREHKIPFYVAAPSTTFDRQLRSGDEIPIEERHPDEVAKGFGPRTAPRGVRVANPAFDVTPARYVGGLITEKGVLRPPYRKAIREMLERAGT